MSGKVRLAQEPVAGPGLPIRLGFLGLPEEDEANEHLAPPNRYTRLFDYLAGHGLGAFGIHHPRFILQRGDAPWMRRQAEAFGIELHCVWAPVSPTLFRHPRRLRNAHAAIHAELAATAADAGCLTYTVCPPRRDECRLDAFASELGGMQDLLADRAGDLRLHVGNGPAKEYHLHDAAALRDFASSEGLHPTLHAGFLYAATGRELSQPGWNDLVKTLPESTLYCYANMDMEAGQCMGTKAYTRDDRATPAAAPLLNALLRRPGRTLLVQGNLNERETAEIFLLAARLAGLDGAQILANLGFAHPHRRITRLI